MVAGRNHTAQPNGYVVPLNSPRLWALNHADSRVLSYAVLSLWHTHCSAKGQQYVGRLNVLNDHCNSDYNEDNHHMVPFDTRGRGMKHRLNLRSKPILDQISETPPWLSKTVNICQEVATTSKQNLLILQLKHNFLSHLAKHSDTRHIYFPFPH